MNCCDDYGKCKQGPGCPARETKMTHTTESLMALAGSLQDHALMDDLQSCLNIRGALRDAITELVAERDALAKDAARLDWMQFHGAQVCWGNDGEVCGVRWSDRDDSYKTKLFYDWREAIDAARKGEVA